MSGSCTPIEVSVGEQLEGRVLFGTWTSSLVFKSENKYTRRVVSGALFIAVL